MQVNLTLNSAEVQPGSNFILNVTSTLNSSVSLLAIDQRALALGKDYDINKNYVFDTELIKYDEIPIDNIYDPEIPFYFYYDSYQKKFIDVGAVILTNARQEIPCKPSSDINESTQIPSNGEDESIIENVSTAAPPVLLPPGTVAQPNAKFLETFLFKTIDIETPLNNKMIRGLEVLNETAPPLTTSWIITGIAVSPRYGLGMTNIPTVLNAFMYFYIDFILPNSIKIGEVARLEVLIVNQLNEDLPTDVKFFNNKHQFDAIRPGAYNWTNAPDGHVQNIVIRKQSIYRLRIEIRPRDIGFIEFKVQATSSKAGDMVERQLMVIPEGFATYENHAELVYLDDCDVNGKNFSLMCDPPLGILENTIQVQASVFGDILGSSLSNLESLIRMPYG